MFLQIHRRVKNRFEGLAGDHHCKNSVPKSYRICHEWKVKGDKWMKLPNVFELTYEARMHWEQVDKFVKRVCGYNLPTTKQLEWWKVQRIDPSETDTSRICTKMLVVRREKLAIWLKKCNKIFFVVKSGLRIESIAVEKKSSFSFFL